MSDDMVVLPGERCRIAREEQGLTELEAANKLHLSQTYLKALEADDYERLPEATFVKGYLRNYAKLLGLPADEVANTFQQMVNENALDKPLELPRVAAPPSPGRKLALLILVVLLAALLLWWLWPQSPSLPSLAPPDAEQSSEPDTRDTTDQQGMPSAKEQPSQADSPEPGAVMGSSEPSSNVDAEDVDTIQPEPALSADMPSESQPAEQDAAEQRNVSGAQEAGGLDSLELNFSGNCWVKVSDANGRTLGKGEQTAGDRLALDGEAPFQLTLGDAGAVGSIVLNGETVDLPTNAAGSVVRITLP